jgi:hypothetical protein
MTIGRMVERFSSTNGFHFINRQFFMAFFVLRMQSIVKNVWKGKKRKGGRSFGEIKPVG